MKKVVHHLSEKDLKEIQDLFEKKLALENLLKIVTPEENNIRYEKILSDYGRQCRLFQNWWDNMNQKYNWGTGDFYIDFEQADVIAQ